MAYGIITSTALVCSAFPLRVLTFLLNDLLASRPTDTRVSWPIVYARGRPSCSMRYGWLKSYCVLRTSSFLRLDSAVGVPLWSAGSAPQAAVEISPNDSGSFCGLSFISLVAGRASSETEVIVISRQ